MKIQSVVKSAHKVASEKLDFIDGIFTHWHIYVLLVFFDKRFEIYEFVKIAREYISPPVEHLITVSHLPVVTLIHIIWFVF